MEDTGKLKVNSNYLICCNILNRVESLLEGGNRVQLSKDTLESISDYLSKAIRYIDSSNDLFSSQFIIFGKCMESIDSILSSSDFVAINSDMKEYLVDKLYPTIIEFKVNVGKYLTDNEFDYTNKMDSVIKGIIDTCIENGYYFGY